MNDMDVQLLDWVCIRIDIPHQPVCLEKFDQQDHEDWMARYIAENTITYSALTRRDLKAFKDEVNDHWERSLCIFSVTIFRHFFLNQPQSKPPDCNN